MLTKGTTNKYLNVEWTDLVYGFGLNRFYGLPLQNFAITSIWKIRTSGPCKVSFLQKIGKLLKSEIIFYG